MQGSIQASGLLGNLLTRGADLAMNQESKSLGRKCSVRSVGQVNVLWTYCDLTMDLLLTWSTSRNHFC
jgi:hypothetical protein